MNNLKHFWIDCVWILKNLADFIATIMGNRIKDELVGVLSPSKIIIDIDFNAVADCFQLHHL